MISCSLGSCTLGIGVSICTLGVCVSMRTLGIGGISTSGVAVTSNVTRHGVGVGCVEGVCGNGMLFNNSSNFCNASYSISPFVFRHSLKASVKSVKALTIVSSGVSVGFVICLCLKCTVSDILTPLVCLT